MHLELLLPFPPCVSPMRIMAKNHCCHIFPLWPLWLKCSPTGRFLLCFLFCFGFFCVFFFGFCFFLFFFCFLFFAFYCLFWFCFVFLFFVCILLFVLVFFFGLLYLPFCRGFWIMKRWFFIILRMSLVSPKVLFWANRANEEINALLLGHDFTQYFLLQPAMGGNGSSKYVSESAFCIGTRLEAIFGQLGV